MNYKLDRRMDKGFVAIISCISLFMLMACGSNDAQLGNCWWKYGSGYHIGDMLEELDKNVRNDTVFKSNKHIYAQIINDEKGIPLASASSLEKSFKDEKQTKKELAEKVGTEIAKRSIKTGIKDVAFDKGKYKYHGIIKILADAARAEGLDF